DEDPFVIFAGPQVFELAQDTGGDGVAVGSLVVPAGHWHSFSYTLAPGVNAPGPGVDEALVAQLSSEGYSVWVEGTATRGAESFSFAWGFSDATTYSGCEVDLILDTDGAGAMEATIHADHLFYDDLESEEPDLAFDLIASA